MHTVPFRVALFEVQQFPKKIVHLGIAQSPLHFHVLHDLETDGFHRGKPEKQLGESLRRYRVHGLCASL